MSKSFSIAAISLVSFLFSEMALGYAFETIQLNYNHVEKIEVPNMPPIRSQDGFGLCGTFAAASAIDFINCKQKKLDCSSLKQSEQVSTLDLASYGLRPDDPSKGPDTELNVKIYISGYASEAIRNLYNNSYTVGRESCAPFESELSVSAKTIDQANKDAENLAKKFKQMKTEANFCIDCFAREIRETFPGLGSIQDIRNKLMEPNYGKFLHKLLIPQKCVKDQKERVPVPEFNMTVWPSEGEGVVATPEKFLEKAKKILANGTPIIADAVCFEDPLPAKADDCNSAHSFIISGYSKMCDKNNKCKDAFKVHNSWGQRWQNENRDGWMDAKELIKSTMLKERSFTWLR